MSSDELEAEGREPAEQPQRERARKVLLDLRLERASRVAARANVRRARLVSAEVLASVGARDDAIEDLALEVGKVEAEHRSGGDAQECQQHEVPDV